MLTISQDTAPQLAGSFTQLASVARDVTSKSAFKVEASGKIDSAEKEALIEKLFATNLISDSGSKSIEASVGETVLNLTTSQSDFLSAILHHLIKLLSRKAEEKPAAPKD